MSTWPLLRYVFLSFHTEARDREREREKANPEKEEQVTFISLQKESSLAIKFTKHEKKKPFRFRDHCLNTGGLAELMLC